MSAYAYLCFSCKIGIWLRIWRAKCWAKSPVALTEPEPGEVLVNVGLCVRCQCHTSGTVNAPAYKPLCSTQRVLVLTDYRGHDHD